MKVCLYFIETWGKTKSIENCLTNRNECIWISQTVKLVLLLAQIWLKAKVRWKNLESIVNSQMNFFGLSSFIFQLEKPQWILYTCVKLRPDCLTSIGHGAMFVTAFPVVNEKWTMKNIKTLKYNTIFLSIFSTSLNCSPNWQ